MVAGCVLTASEAEEKRDQLVKDGFVVIPNVMPKALLYELCNFTSELCRKVTVSVALRYQGSSHVVHTTRSQKAGAHMDSNLHNKVVEKLNDEPNQRRVAELLGLESLRPRKRNVGEDINMLIISKPPHGPPLYWHQDFREWNSPVAATPWPHQVCFSYYLSDTTKENGCLRVIPGSHRNWHPLHDLLPNAHEREIQQIKDFDSPVFTDAQGSIDVPVCAGDLVILDARLLHSARANCTNQRRTLVLSWYNCFHFPKPPSWWKGHVPPEIANAYFTEGYRNTRVPNIPWRPRPRDYNALGGPAYARLRSNKNRASANVKSVWYDPTKVPDHMMATPTVKNATKFTETGVKLTKTGVILETTIAATPGINGVIPESVDSTTMSLLGEGSPRIQESAGNQELIPVSTCSPNPCCASVSDHENIVPQPSHVTGTDVMDSSEEKLAKKCLELHVEPVQVPRNIWQKYRLPDGGGNWWWCELDGDWFLECNPSPWAKYSDPELGRHYWWKSDEKWFWI